MSSAPPADERLADDARPDRVEVMTTSLDNQSHALRKLVRTAVERTRAGEEMDASEVNAIRTELDELQGVIEDFLAGRCDDTEPWESAGVHIPGERLEDRLEELTKAR